MPGARIFVDSNVLLYARDLELSPKAGPALEWLRAGTRQGAICANLQVLNEVTNVMLRKRNDLAENEVFAAVDELQFLGTGAITATTTALARQIRLTTRYSWWDCVLLASALELGCTHFLSEDLQDGQRIEAGDRALTIIDPFAHTPERILA